MRWNRTRTFFLAVFGAFLLMPCWTRAMDLNQFYQSFVAHLKASRYVQLEQLVEQNRNEALMSLAIIGKQIQDEADSRRKEALTMISTELEELVAVTERQKDCALSDRTVQRGQQAGLLDEGLEAFRRAMILCPGNLAAVLGFADLNKRRGNFEESTAAYEKALALEPDSPEALLGLGEVCYSAGLYERGASYLERLLQKERGNKKAEILLESSTKQIAIDRDGMILAPEIADRLWSSLEGNLMCMCPSHAKLIARIRFRSITFDTDSTKLDGKARNQLAELAKALKTEALKGGRYLIEGHADPAGPAQYNKELSARRAEAVRRYLVDVLKLNPDILATDGVGSFRSFTNNETPAGRRANRRIEIISLGASVKSIARMAPESGNER